LRHQTMDKVQKHNSFNTNTPSSESYRNTNITTNSARNIVYKSTDTNMATAQNFEVRQILA